MSAKLTQVRWAWQFYFLQIFGGVTCAELCQVAAGHAFGFAGLLANLVYGIAQGLFVALAFRHTGASRARQIAKSLYLGEMLKLLTVMLLGWMVVQVFRPPMLPFVITFIVLQSAYFWAPLWLNE